MGVDPGTTVDLSALQQGTLDPFPRMGSSSLEEQARSHPSGPRSEMSGAPGPDLAKLKDAAEAVKNRSWEVWPNVHGDPIVVEAGGRGQFAEICRVSTRFDDYGRAVAGFIAAADPEAVLALISRLEAAEAAAGQKCACGAMLRDTTVVCPVHPDVRPRTVRERIDFEQAFNATLGRSTAKGKE